MTCRPIQLTTSMPAATPQPDAAASELPLLRLIQSATMDLNPPRREEAVAATAKPAAGPSLNPTPSTSGRGAGGSSVGQMVGGASGSSGYAGSLVEFEEGWEDGGLACGVGGERCVVCICLCVQTLPLPSKV